MKSISATGCGVTKVCFSNPSKCDPATSSSCYFMSSLPVPGQLGTYHFEMTGPTVGYVAMGFSDDQRMGNDDIYICGLDSNGVPQLQHAYSTGRTTPQIIALGNVIDVKAKVTNGIISCSFTSSNPISTQRSTGSNNTSYFLQFVYGATSTGLIQLHSRTFVSNTKVDLSIPLTVEEEDHPPIIKAHGALMLIAWMTTGSLGMIIARYMKGMSKGNQFCGKDLWFLAHVALMTLTVVATIIAFILAFVYVGEWAGDAGSHPVLGVLVMILSFIQPFSALFRCGPQHQLRYIFNFAHTLNAVVIKFLAVAAIFTGLQLFDVADGWLVKVMGGFVGWEMIFFIILDLQSRCKNKGTPRETKAIK
ncbi:putative ferric-chelate reductase 1 [Aplochiton taeniatus]